MSKMQLSKEEMANHMTETLRSALRERGLTEWARLQPFPASKHNIGRGGARVELAFGVRVDIEFANERGILGDQPMEAWLHAGTVGWGSTGQRAPDEALLAADLYRRATMVVLTWRLRMKEYLGEHELAPEAA